MNGLRDWLTFAKKHGKQLDDQERFYSALGGLFTLIVYLTFLQITFFSGQNILAVGDLKESAAIVGAFFFPTYAAFLFWRTFG